MCIEVDIEALYENQKPRMPFLYFVNCANNAEAIKAYEILKGMGYSSSDKAKTQLKDSFFVYVYEIKKRYRKTRQE